MKILSVISLAAILAGCGGHDAKNPEAVTAAPVRVQTIEVHAEEWPLVHEAVGTVRARTATTLSSRVMGSIGEIRVQPGDRVSAGQLLVTIDSRDLESGVRQAQAAETEARSAIAEADNGVAAADAQLRLAQVTFKRMQSLHEKTSISDQEFDEAQARLRAAEATFAMARSKRTQLDAKIAQAKQAVESAGVIRSYTQILAPFAGVVTEKPAQPGQLATPGMPLLTIEQIGSYRLEAAVDESMLGSIRAGQRVNAALDSLAAGSVAARIEEIVPAVDPQSRTFVVKAALPAVPNLRSGVFGRLLIERGTRRTVVIPAEAIIQRGELQFVLVVENGLARTRMITAGSRRDGRAEVLSGLAEGDRIVHPRPANLADGARIEVR